MKYTDEKDRIIFAGPGLGSDKFMALYTINGRGSHRLKSPALPIRQTLNEANADLAEYAKKHGFIPDDENELDTLTQEIISYKNQTAQNFIEIGKRLKLAKKKLGHGQWLDWLRDKVEFTDRQARRLIQAADEFSNRTTSSDLPISKIFELLSLPAEKRDKFTKQNDVKKMSVKQLRQAVKAEKNTDKITTTATIETVSNTATSRYLPTDTAAKIDVQPDMPVVDGTYSMMLIDKIKDGYVSFKTAAEIARKYPRNEPQQSSEMMRLYQEHQQELSELDEEYRPKCAFATRWIFYSDLREINIYTALFDSLYYFIGATKWINAGDGNPCYLEETESANWKRAFETEDEASLTASKLHAETVYMTMKPDQVNFTFEITPDIAAQINQSTADQDDVPEVMPPDIPDPVPLEIDIVREKLITRFENSRKIHLGNESTESRVFTGFYTLLISYLQNVDAYVLKKIMEEENG